MSMVIDPAFARQLLLFSPDAFHDGPDGPAAEKFNTLCNAIETSPAELDLQNVLHQHGRGTEAETEARIEAEAEAEGHPTLSSAELEALTEHSHCMRIWIQRAVRASRKQVVPALMGVLDSVTE